VATRYFVAHRPTSIRSAISSGRVRVIISILVVVVRMRRVVTVGIVTMVIVAVGVVTMMIVAVVIVAVVILALLIVAVVIVAVRVIAMGVAMGRQVAAAIWLRLVLPAVWRRVDSQVRMMRVWQVRAVRMWLACGVWGLVWVWRVWRVM